MPIWATADRIRRQWLGWLVSVNIGYALANIAGPAENASQRILREVAPIWAWYGLLIVSGFLIAWGFSVSGAALGMFAWLFLVLASVASIWHQTALSWGGPVLLGLPMGCHAMIIFQVGTGLDADRERRQRAA